MGIFTANSNTHSEPSKEDGTVQGHELDGQDGSLRPSSQTRDQADMAKLGIQQQTRVRRASDNNLYLIR